MGEINEQDRAAKYLPIHAVWFMTARVPFGIGFATPPQCYYGIALLCAIQQLCYSH